MSKMNKNNKMKRKSQSVKQDKRKNNLFIMLLHLENDRKL
jgi:hypothetical protein